MILGSLVVESKGLLGHETKEQGRGVLQLSA